MRIGRQRHEQPLYQAKGGPAGQGQGQWVPVDGKPTVNNKNDSAVALRTLQGLGRFGAARSAR